jgi:chromate transporter
MKSERRQPAASPPSLWSLFFDFLKIGATAFGGFMALISVVQHQIVERRKLLSQNEMLDGISLATILPGPVAVNVVAYTGYRLRGGPGALVCAVGVILPAFVLIVCLSEAYFRWGHVPTVNKLFLGFVPAVAAIIVNVAWGMARKAKPGVAEIALAIAAFLLLVLKGGSYTALLIIAAAGLIGWLVFGRFSDRTTADAHDPPRRRKQKQARLLAIDAPFVVAALLAFDAGLAAKLFLTFAGMSVLLFGGGFVVIPLIEQIIVNEHAWLSHQEFVDAIALGQVTPGPILISAAFIGYKLMGLAGATVATVGIFLPPAVLMVLGANVLSRARNSRDVQAGLRGVRAAVIGMIAAAAWSVGATAVMGWQSGAIFLAAFVALLRLRIDVAWVIPAAGLAGLVLF